ncbi:MAG: hypothetical protein IJ087_07190 [Eggerthellaceae bacterium]|nr:hypothetical protein [Eggerthellaceae bacterium]
MIPLSADEFGFQLGGHRRWITKTTRLVKSSSFRRYSHCAFGTDPSEAMEAADETLYRAKRRQ